MIIIDRRTADERGAVIILVGLLLVALLIFGAFAIDIGGAYNQRRQAQGGADAAALAAAQDLAGAVASEANATSHAISYAKNSTTIGLQSADFTTCGTETPPSSIHGLSNIVWQAPGVNNCIRFDQSDSLVWVDLPRNHPYKTVLGQFAGRPTISIGGAAVAGIKPAGEGGVLPFGLSAGTGAGQQCIKAGSGNPGGNCTGNITGNFGFLEFGYYGNPILGTTTSCPNPTLIPNNIAAGIDHSLSILSGPPGNGSTVVEATGTTCALPKSPNSVFSETGNKPSEFDTGILHGTGFTDGLDARLTRTGQEASISTFTATTTIASVPKVDDTGLWRFIPTASFNTNNDYPASCYRSQFNSLLSTYTGSTLKTKIETQLTDCFAHYETGDATALADGSPAGGGCTHNPCLGNLFTVKTGPQTPVALADLQLSPRFSYVPVLTTSFASGHKLMSYAGFIAIYIQNLSGNGFDFDPGVGDGNQGGNKADSLSAYVFDPHMLPGTLGTDPFLLGQSQEVALFR